MMEYRNIYSGDTLESNAVISGNGWQAVEESPAIQEKTAVKGSPTKKTPVNKTSTAKKGIK